ncbi:MAG TPA: type IX secretion system sortase PorU [Bacteroidales bacterium]|nr:type IX secretion system sortase PorU [Bacteroidales bacterium]
MKHLVLFFLSLFVVSGIQAGNSRSLEWYQPSNAMPDFEGSYHPDGKGLPVFFESQTPEVEAADYSVRLIYPVYRKLETSEIKVLKPLLNTIPDSLVVSITKGVVRKKTVLDISILPFICKNGSYFKLVSFDLEITPINQVSLRNLQATNYASNSVLKTGKWVKISISESGMYKLSYSDIKNMGIDPAKVQIYGYGGKLLAENFALAGYMDDLPEVAIYKEMGDDGIFNAGDFILFYGQGPISWNYNTSNGMYLRTRNHYSDKAYYFVGERAQATLTTSVSTFTGTPNKEITSFTDLILHEEEKVNLGENVAGDGTGRQLYGEDFISNSSQQFTFNVTNPDSIGNSKIFIEFAVNNPNSTTCNVFVNNAMLTSMNFPSVQVTDTYRYAYESSSIGTFKQKSSTLTVQLNYNKSQLNSRSRAFLNDITLNVRRLLKMSGSVMPFCDPLSVGAGNIGRFTLQNATSKLLVFDVTDPKNMIQMNLNPNAGNLEFVNSTNTLREYVAVEAGGNIPKPTIEGRINNQNLHGQTNVDMVIVAPSEFLPYAKKLADAHTAHDGLNVLVVTPEQVYNEFSSGTPDATAIRRMMKLYYDRGKTESELPDYLLLFGDGVYDNRLVSTMFANSISKPNKILTYQSVESTDGNYSYVTDDYFGFLDDTEGSSLSSAKLDLGIGRFPVTTTAQAATAVDKAIAYMYNSRLGTWKNRLLFLADDGDNYLHVGQADALANKVGAAHPEFMINKIYVDAYTRVTGPSSVTVPDANIKFAELMNAGLLMLNYTGHGSTFQWAEEKLLLNSDIEKMNNKCLPLWVTATCDFTRYDAYDPSGGELVFLKENGGGIALFSTTRIVYSANNYVINRCFLDNIFAKNNGVRYTLGEIMNLAKRSDALNGDANKLSFTLIGDPALKLGYPEFSAQVTEVNGKAVSMMKDTLQALSTVTVSGKIFREDGTCATDFNGLISPTILDANEVIAKLGRSSNDTLTIYDRSKVLFLGKDSVVNGLFSFTFVVPKDNSYSFREGRINLYANDENGINEAQGYYENFVLGGTDLTVETDRVGPQIELYLNNEKFSNGGTVQETPTLIARISDQNGLSTSGNGIGHDLILMVDDEPSRLYNLNSFFSADVGSYQSGVVRFQIPELAAGKHHLTFRAWDVQNNSTIDTLNFVVKPGLEPQVGDIRFVQQGNSGKFIFTHDRPQAISTIKLSILDLLGRVVWQSDWNMQAESNTSDLLVWNLTDTNERRITNGVYICRVILVDPNGSQSFGSKKILITGQ